MEGEDSSGSQSIAITGMGTEDWGSIPGRRVVSAEMSETTTLAKLRETMCW